MSPRLPPHPVAITATMTSCALMNYAVDPDVLATALPTGLEPRVLGATGWLSVVIADMRRLRPAALPDRVGISYRQIVYRAVVTCRGATGVHFLRSDANSRLACLAGSALSLFRFHHAAIEHHRSVDHLRVRVRSRDRHGNLTVEAGASPVSSEPVSRLGGVAELRRDLIELFVAFDHDPRRDEHQVLRIRRGAWDVQPLVPSVADCAFMERGPIFRAGMASLDSIVIADDLPYYWHPLQRASRSGEPHVIV